MNDLLTATLELLRDVLGHGVADANNAISLALTGETLRRLAADAPPGRPEVAEALAAYDAQLRRSGSLLPFELEGDLRNALAELRRAADGEPTGDFEDALRGVDEVLMVAAAAHRVQRLERATLRASFRPACATTSLPSSKT
jgi:hypothetical protein